MKLHKNNKRKFRPSLYIDAFALLPRTGLEEVLNADKSFPNSAGMVMALWGFIPGMVVSKAISYASP